jgi:hypothetical protein
MLCIHFDCIQSPENGFRFRDSAFSKIKDGTNSGQGAIRKLVSTVRLTTITDISNAAFRLGEGGNREAVEIARQARRGRSELGFVALA